jgi:hypothetical protein
LTITENVVEDVTLIEDVSTVSEAVNTVSEVVIDVEDDDEDYSDDIEYDEDDDEDDEFTYEDVVREDDYRVVELLNNTPVSPDAIILNTPSVTETPISMSDYMANINRQLGLDVDITVDTSYEDSFTQY